MRLLQKGAPKGRAQLVDRRGYFPDSAARGAAIAIVRKRLDRAALFSSSLLLSALLKR